jgi:hypothetical protein
MAVRRLRTSSRPGATDFADVARVSQPAPRALRVVKDAHCEVGVRDILVASHQDVQP